MAHSRKTICAWQSESGGPEGGRGREGEKKEKRGEERREGGGRVVRDGRKRRGRSKSKEELADYQLATR